MLEDVPVKLEARGAMAGVALYAALFEPAVTELELYDLPRSHMQGPHLLNVLRVVDMPQVLAMAAEGRKVTVRLGGTEGWEFATETAKRLGWPAERVRFGDE
jgi:hypothetical protein